jgi:hypothetical protein
VAKAKPRRVKPKEKAFSLPKGWYRKTAEAIFDELAKDLGPLKADTAWRYLFAAVAWFQPLKDGPYLHLNDQLKNKGGKALAKRGEEFLKANLAPGSNLEPTELIDQFAQRYTKERDAQGITEKWQRNNVTGNSFEAALQVLIHRINDVWPARTPSLNTLRGFELAPEGYHSRPDLVLFSAFDFRLLISTKWTLRKERLGTYLHEAYFYKQRRPDIQVAFVVSEFNLNILDWLAHDPLVDRVYHVNLPMLLAVHPPFPGTEPKGSVPLEKLIEKGGKRDDYARWLRLSRRLFDMSDLFADIEVLKAGGVPAPPADVDPEAEVEDESEELAADDEDSTA